MARLSSTVTGSSGGWFFVSWRLGGHNDKAGLVPRFAGQSAVNRRINELGNQSETASGGVCPGLAVKFASDGRANDFKCASGCGSFGGGFKNWKVACCGNDSQVTAAAVLWGDPLDNSINQRGNNFKGGWRRAFRFKAVNTPPTNIENRRRNGLNVDAIHTR